MIAKDSHMADMCGWELKGTAWLCYSAFGGDAVIALAHSVGCSFQILTLICSYLPLKVMLSE